MKGDEISKNAFKEKIEFRF